MSKWIIRIDPQKNGFELAESLAEAPIHDGVMALMPIQHEDDLRKGDRVYLWQLGARPGLCATAELIGGCEERPQAEWQQRFGDPKQYDPTARRVLLQVKRYTTDPVSRNFDGAALWRPNSGTTQQCPSPGCPVQTVAEFDSIAETFTSISSPSNEEYRRMLRDALGRAPTDRVVQVLARVEQAYWRKLLFGTSLDGSCAICARHLPVDLLVVAHIKQRSECSEDERLDPENVMAACLLGCDILFERGYIRVDESNVRTNIADLSSTVVDAITMIVDKPASLAPPGWTANRAKYFKAREESIRVAAYRRTGA